MAVPGEVRAYQVDVTDERAVAAAAQDFIARFGPPDLVIADYLMPTTTEVPAPVILHFESLSPFTPLGAKGVGEGNCMSTPVCVANAVADALGVAEIDLPLTPAKLATLVRA